MRKVWHLHMSTQGFTLFIRVWHLHGSTQGLTLYIRVWNVHGSTQGFTHYIRVWQLDWSTQGFTCYIRVWQLHWLTQGVTLYIKVWYLHLWTQWFIHIVCNGVHGSTKGFTDRNRRSLLIFCCRWIQPIKALYPRSVVSACVVKVSFNSSLMMTD